MNCREEGKGGLAGLEGLGIWSEGGEGDTNLRVGGIKCVDLIL